MDRYKISQVNILFKVIIEKGHLLIASKPNEDREV